MKNHITKPLKIELSFSPRRRLKNGRFDRLSDRSLRLVEVTLSENPVEKPSIFGKSWGGFIL